MQAVIFDFDGVLFDSEHAYLDVRYQFAKEKNPSLQIEDLYESVGCTIEQTWRVIASKINNGQSWEELLLEFTPLAEKTYPGLDFKPLLRRDVPKTLEILAVSGYKLAVASANNSSLVHRALEQAQILHCFDTVICGDQCRSSKPSTEIYVQTAGALKIPAGKCLALEDSTIGIQSAHDAGMTVVALRENRFPFSNALADYVINVVAEILKIVESRS